MFVPNLSLTYIDSALACKGSTPAGFWPFVALELPVDLIHATHAAAPNLRAKQESMVRAVRAAPGLFLGKDHETLWQQVHPAIVSKRAYPAL